MRHDQRSAEALAYRWMYGTSAWQHARAYQLHAQPLCEMCTGQGLLESADVVNHREPHRGDWDLFLSPANLQSLCKTHHDSAVQSFEKTGRERGCDAKGNPIDPGSHWK